MSLIRPVSVHGKTWKASPPSDDSRSLELLREESTLTGPISGPPSLPIESSRETGRERD